METLVFVAAQFFGLPRQPRIAAVEVATASDACHGSGGDSRMNAGVTTTSRDSAAPDIPNVYVCIVPLASLGTCGLVAHRRSAVPSNPLHLGKR